jgi:DNA-binding PadR family transcriptional regulator
MSFPILKYLALKTEPVTAYQLERTELDVIHDGKTKKALIDKPTIYDSLKLMQKTTQVESKDPKSCKDGRVRKKYVVTRQGIRDLLWSQHLGYVEISKQYVRKLAEIRHDFFPKIFDLWPEFTREQAEDAAWRRLLDIAGNTLTESIESMFLALVEMDLISPDNPDHDVWLQAALRNQRIGETLLTWTIRGVAGNIEHVNEMLQLLSPWAPTVLQKTRLRDSLLRFLERMPSPAEDEEASTSVTGSEQ